MKSAGTRGPPGTISFRPFSTYRVRWIMRKHGSLMIYGRALDGLLQPQPEVYHK